MTRRILLLALVVALLVAALGAVAFAKSGKQSLYLYEKDGDPDWNIVEDGAWGKLNFKPFKGEYKFVFNGHGLEPETDYTLIYYPDPWPGAGLVCFGDDESNRGGNVHIKEKVDVSGIPFDTNPPFTDENYLDGAKIWLVLSDHVDCGVGMTGWDPTEYLFENNLVTFP